MIAIVICCRPPMTRLFTKSRMAGSPARRTASGRDTGWTTCARGTATARPSIVVVAVQVGADGGGPGIRLAVLAPRAVWVPGQVELSTVGVDHEHDEDLAAVDEPRDPLIRAVVVGQPAQDRQGLLRRQVLTGMVEGIEHDLGLRLVRGDVVGDLGGPDLAALVGRADGELLHDVRGGPPRPGPVPRPSRCRCDSRNPWPGNRRPRPGRRSPGRAGWTGRRRPRTSGYACRPVCRAAQVVAMPRWC